MPRVFRYYRPPEMIRQIGRELHPGRSHHSADKFAHLQGQLTADEILISLFENQVRALVAAHIGSGDRLEEIENTWGELGELYAVSTQELNNRISVNQMEGSD